MSAHLAIAATGRSQQFSRCLLKQVTSARSACQRPGQRLAKDRHRRNGVQQDMAYDHLEIEPRWQRYWDEHGTFRATRRSGRPKRYVLDMFPYPSGAGLHVGHPEGYTATDIMARSRRMRGYDVLHPMGWDAFGLPAEQHAIETGQHPAGTTANNIATFKRQLKMLGFSYDWSREIDTTDPGYVRWTQWIFLQLFQRGSRTRRRCPSTGAPRSAPCSPTKKSSTARASAAAIPSIARRSDSGCCGSPPMPIGSPRTWRSSTGPRGRSPRSAAGSGVRRAPRSSSVSTVTRTRASPSSRRGPIRSWARRTSCSRPSMRSTRTMATPAQRAAVVAYVEAATRKSDLDRIALAKTKTGVPPGAVAIHPITGAACRSGSPTTCSAATAPAPSWPSPGTMSATSSSRPPSVFRSSRS